MEKKNGILLLLLILFLMIEACTKRNVSPVSFNVTTDSVTYHISNHGIDTGTGALVKFVFSGNPDYIVFYSGENGHRYQNRTLLCAQISPLSSCQRRQNNQSSLR